MIARLWCRIVGHDWKNVIGSRTRHSQMVACSRCASTGWRLM